MKVVVNLAIYNIPVVDPEQPLHFANPVGRRLNNWINATTACALDSNPAAIMCLAQMTSQTVSTDK